MSLKFCLFTIVLIGVCGNVKGWRSFSVIQEDVYCNVTAPDYISDTEVYVRKLNRTFDALNSTSTFLKPIEDSLIVWARSFELRGMKYHPSILDTKLDLCKFFENPFKESPIFALFYPIVTKHGNWPTKCPVPAGTYYIRNFNVNEEAFPPYFPVNKWRFVISILYRDRMLFETTWSFRIEPKRFSFN